MPTNGVCNDPYRKVFWRRLEGVRKSGNGGSAYCPAHEDRKGEALA